MTATDNPHSSGPLVVGANVFFIVFCVVVVVMVVVCVCGGGGGLPAGIQRLQPLKPF